MNYFGDHDAETAHFGAFIGEELLSIGSLYLAPLNSPHAKQQSAAHTWQLRGMATSPQHAGQGLGAAVLQAAISHASTQGGKLLWCNAREGALGFYQKFAFSSISNTFDLPGIGPHQVMIRILT
jgi:GNAT superfamily N-acetyltransferase